MGVGVIVGVGLGVFVRVEVSVGDSVTMAAVEVIATGVLVLCSSINLPHDVISAAAENRRTYVNLFIEKNPSSENTVFISLPALRVSPQIYRLSNGQEDSIRGKFVAPFC